MHAQYAPQGKLFNTCADSDGLGFAVLCESTYVWTAGNTWCLESPNSETSTEGGEYGFTNVFLCDRVFIVDGCSY